MGLKKKALFLLPVFLFLFGCAANTRIPFVYTRLMMDTVVKFSLWQKNPPAVESGFKEIQRIEKNSAYIKKTANYQS